MEAALEQGDKRNVLLIHGILMKPLVMRYIGKQLERAGYRVFYANYHSIKKSSKENAQHIYQDIKQKNLSNLHIVAHSLGGLVTLHLLDQFDDVPMGNVVMLGSPVQGSLLAQKLVKWPVAGRLVRQSLEQALSGERIPAWSAVNRQWSMIAGNSRHGLGWLIGGLPEQSDGTVMLSETINPAQKSHTVLPVSHTGMLYSREVVQKIISDLAGYESISTKL